MIFMGQRILSLFYSKRQKYLPFAIKQMHTTARGILLLRNMRSAQTETTKVVSYNNETHKISGSVTVPLTPL